MSNDYYGKDGPGQNRPRSEPQPTLSVRFSPATLDKIKAEAERLGVSPRMFCRHAVEDKIGRSEFMRRHAADKPAKAADDLP